MSPPAKTKSTLVSVVEVRLPNHAPITIQDMPMRVEQRDGITALVLWVLGEETAITLLLSDGDKRDMGNLLEEKVMSIIQIEVTDENEFNKGWLEYLLGLPRPAGDRTEDGRATAGQNGWDMGRDTPPCAQVRHVFTRQNDIDHPQYVVREVKAEPVKAKVVVGE